MQRLKSSLSQFTLFSFPTLYHLDSSSMLVSTGASGFWTSNNCNSGTNSALSLPALDVFGLITLDGNHLSFPTNGYCIAFNPGTWPGIDGNGDLSYQMTAEFKREQGTWCQGSLKFVGLHFNRIDEYNYDEFYLRYSG